MPDSADEDAETVRSLRRIGFGFPEVHGKSPWPGHDDLAVRDRTFAYLSVEGEPASVSLKLPYTGAEALAHPCAVPTGYGLGRSGWVTFTATAGPLPPLERLAAWLEESYRAQAPRRLVRQLDDRG